MQRAAMFVIGVLINLAWASPTVADDWPNWRGPKHDGISLEKGFQTRWQKKPPKLWEREIGPAFSGVSCVAGKAYTCGTIDKRQVLLCLNADTGDILWQTPIEKEYRERQGGDGTRATPTVSEGRVYILGAKGKLLCCDSQTGKEVWSRELDAPPRWGYSGSVLIEGELAIVTAGGSGALLALDKQSGKEVWNAGDGAVGYATPYPFTFDGRRYIVGFLAKSAIVAEAADGRLVWSTPWETDWDVNAAAPIFHAGRLFLSSGYGTGSGVFELAAEGGKLAGKKLWSPMPSKIVLGKFQSAVLHEGHLYVSDEKALKCVEFATGKEKWSERGIGNGTVVLADGHLVVLTETGELQMARVSPEKYEPSTKVEVLTGRCWTVPTLYKGRLYVRNLKQIACYDLAQE